MSLLWLYTISLFLESISLIKFNDYLLIVTLHYITAERARPYLTTIDCGAGATDFINAVYVDVNILVWFNLPVFVVLCMPKFIIFYCLIFCPQFYYLLLPHILPPTLLFSIAPYSALNFIIFYCPQLYYFLLPHILPLTLLSSTAPLSCWNG